MATEGKTGAGTSVSPDLVWELASGFMAAKHLFVASEVGLFRELGNGSASLDELASRTGMPVRPLRILADAMAALGLIERHNGRYQNGPAAATYLAGRGPVDLGPLLRLWDHLSYPAWLQFEEAVRTGKSPRKGGQFSETDWEIFSVGVEAFSAGPAQALAAAYDFNGHRRILDLGGGTGTFLIPILERYPGLVATLFDVPPVTPVAMGRLEGHPVGDRIQIVAGDFFTDPIPIGHDAVLLANVIHVFPAERNLELLRLARQSVQVGARLLIVDLWTDASKTDPVLAAVLAGEFFVAVEGDVYSEDEGRSWLEQSGWRSVGRRPLVGPISVLVGLAV